MKKLNQTNNISIIDDLFKKTKINLYNKYFNIYNKKVYKILINSILSNRKTHFVTEFKDFLLYEDYSEFLKRFYKRDESFVRIIKVSKYFKETSVLFPNYSPLIESKYIISNIIRKQRVINKQENYKLQNFKKKKHYKDKNEKEYIKGNIFFNSKVYKEILNESESLISSLFGIENKDRKGEKRKNDTEKEIEELLNLINIIDYNEYNNNANNTKIQYINKVNTNEIQNNTIPDKSKTIVNNKRTYYAKITDNTNNNIPKTTILNKYNKNFKNVIKIERNNKMFQENNKNNELSQEDNEESKEYIENNKSQEEDKNMIYHRKVNSTLMGEYLNKLELPSNSNVVSLLKIANETYADTYNKNSIREILYQTVKNTTGTEIKYSKNKYVNLHKLFHNNNTNNNNEVNENKNSNSNIMNKILCLGKIIQNPTTTKSRNNKENKILKKIEIPKTYEKSNYGIKKRMSPLPLSTRNYTSTMSIYEKNGNDVKFKNRNTITNDKRLINNTGNSNSGFNTYKKKEERKSIYANNPNITGPYSKPKCFYKDKKFNGISAKHLFNKPNKLINVENEKKAEYNNII